MNANLTISRGSEDQIRIKLGDSSSRQTIYEGKVTLEDFALAVTGLAHIPVLTTKICSPEEAKLFGLERVTKTARCPKTSSTSKSDQAEAVQADYETNWQPHGWELMNDGVNSQQNGEKHNYIVCKFLSHAEAKKLADEFEL